LFHVGNGYPNYRFTFSHGVPKKTQPDQLAERLRSTTLVNVFRTMRQTERERERELEDLHSEYNHKRLPSSSK